MADVIEITAEVRERELRLTSIPMMPSGSRNHLRIRIAFDAEWDGTTKTIVAYRDLAHPYHVPLGLDGTALIPHEVLAEQGVAYLGVFGVFGDQRITSTIVRYGVNEGAITEGLQPSDPTPEMWDQLISAVNEVRQAAESAMRDAQTAAQSAQQSEQAAAGSATQADGAATRAETAADTAATSAQAAETAKTDAQTAQRTAAQSAADAKTAATRAEQAAGSLSTAVTQAQDAARAAQQSATQAQDHAKSAGDSAASAAQAQQGASNAESAARQSAAQAQKSQETATQAATEAGESARQAAGAQTAAQNSAQSAGQQANAAATSAQQAQQSQIAAAGSATSAQESAAEAAKQATASEASAVRAETAATEVEQSAQQIAGAIDRLAIHETAAGNPAVIRDGADWKMEGLRVYGQSEQVTTTGAQLLDYENIIENKVYSQSGLLENAIGYMSSTKIGVIGSSQYSLSGLSNVAAIIVQFAQDGSLLDRKPSQTNGAFTTLPNATTIAFTFYSNVEKEQLKNMMVSAGNVAKPFEPYTGGKPAPSPEYPQEIVSREVSSVVVTGSNLLPPDDYFETATNKYFCKNAGLLLRAGVKYVFSCDGGTTNLYIENKTAGETAVKGYDKTEVSYTPPKDGLYYFMMYNEKGVSNFTNFRVNVGSKMPYEHYHSQPVTLSAPVTLRGVPVKTGGNVTIGGKQYMADRITERDGVVGVERWVKWLALPVAEMNNCEEYPGWRGFGYTVGLKYPIRDVLCSHVLASGVVNINPNTDVIFIRNASTNITQSQWLSKYPDEIIQIAMQLEASEFAPLPEPDQQSIRALRTYHGNTVVTAGAHTEVDYISDPKLYIDGKVNALVTAYMQSIPVTIPLLDEEVVGNGG